MFLYRGSLLAVIHTVSPTSGLLKSTESAAKHWAVLYCTVVQFSISDENFP
jgi:hypothetical protein